MFSIIAREKAHLLWSTRQRFVVDPFVMDSLSHLTHYLLDTDCPWEVPIRMIIPRDPHFSPEVTPAMSVVSPIVLPYSSGLTFLGPQPRLPVS